MQDSTTNASKIDGKILKEQDLAIEEGALAREDRQPSAPSDFAASSPSEPARSRGKKALAAVGAGLGSIAIAMSLLEYPGQSTDIPEARHHSPEIVATAGQALAKTQQNHALHGLK